MNDEKDTAIIGAPDVKGWDWQRSVDKMRVLLPQLDQAQREAATSLVKWKTLGVEALRELWVAHEALVAPGARNDLGTEPRGWEAYCKAIKLNKRKADRWLNRYDPATNSIKEYAKLEKGIELERKQAPLIDPDLLRKGTVEEVAAAMGLTLGELRAHVVERWYHFEWPSNKPKNQQPQDGGNGHHPNKKRQRKLRMKAHKAQRAAEQQQAEHDKSIQVDPHAPGRGYRTLDQQRTHFQRIEQDEDQDEDSKVADEYLLEGQKDTQDGGAFGDLDKDEQQQESEYEFLERTGLLVTISNLRAIMNQGLGLFETFPRDADNRPLIPPEYFKTVADTVGTIFLYTGKIEETYEGLLQEVERINDERLNANLNEDEDEEEGASEDESEDVQGEGEAAEEEGEAEEMDERDTDGPDVPVIRIPS